MRLKLLGDIIKNIPITVMILVLYNPPTQPFKRLPNAIQCTLWLHLNHSGLLHHTTLLPSSPPQLHNSQPHKMLAEEGGGERPLRINVQFTVPSAFSAYYSLPFYVCGSCTAATVMMTTMSTFISTGHYSIIQVMIII